MGILATALLFLIAIDSCEGSTAAVETASIGQKKGGGLGGMLSSFTAPFKELYSDHQTCNQIRKKQNLNKAALKAEWKASGVDDKEIRTRLKRSTGGITYEEFRCLQKGKSDTGKSGTFVFYVLAFPKFWPYMVMFNKENILPSQFAKRDDYFRETKNEALSRGRSHAVLQTLMNLEKNAHVPGFKLNPFAPKTKQMEKFYGVVDNLVETLKSNPGPDYVMKKFDKNFFSREKPKPKDFRLSEFPSYLTSGLARTLAAGNSKGFNDFIPNFIHRKNVLNHIQQVTLNDEFLINEAVDINSLSGEALVETCNDRLIPTVDVSENEMRRKLNTWLRYSAIVPGRRTRETNEYFNANLARSALLCYNALDSMRHQPSASKLPRLVLESSATLE